MSDYYDRDGAPIDIDTWSRLLGDRAYRRVGRDELPGDVVVSTVWLGLNHAWDGTILIFETMIFGGTYNDATWRYETLAQARASHERIVAALRAGAEP